MEQPLNSTVGFESPQQTTTDQLEQLRALGKPLQYDPYPPRTPAQPELFSIGRVQFSLDQPLQLLLCNAHLLLFFISPPVPTPSSPPQLVRIDLNEPSVVDTIPLLIPALFQPQQQPRTAQQQQPQPATIYHIHCDPTGRHVLLSLTSAQNYYISLSPASINQQRTSNQLSLRRTAAHASATPGPAIRLLSKLKGLLISAIGWHPSSYNGLPQNSTHEIILGTESGALYTTLLVDHHSQEPSSDLSITAAFSRIDRSSVDRYLKPLYTLPNSSDDYPAVRGIWISNVWYQHTGQNKTIIKRALVLVITSSRLFQFVDQVGILKSKRDDDTSEEVLERLFTSYQSNRALPKSLELQALQNSQLHVYNPIHLPSTSSNSHHSPNSPILTWMTGGGVFCGEIVHGNQEPGDGVIGASQLIPFPLPKHDLIKDSTSSQDPSLDTQLYPSSTSPVPLAFCPTQYHIVLLFPDRIQIVCRLDSHLVHEEILDLKTDEKIRAITMDPVNQTYWLYSDESIFELIVKNEDRDIWKVYLARKAFEKALSHAHTAIDRDKILVSQADHYLDTAKYIPAAQIYAQCSKPFEEVVLGFIDRGERDALRYYLISRLERLKRQDLTQRMMLATWLTEIYLAKINELEDLAGSDPSAGDEAANIVAEQQLIEDELQQFLRTYKADLDQRTTFDLITSHGRKDVMIYYANLVGDHQRIIRHYILEEDWKKAIDGLNRQADLELYYKFAPVLVSHDARSATTAFMRQPKLDVKRLIPALIPPRSSAKRRKSKIYEENAEIVIEYLKFVISRLNNSDAPVHNALLTLYATQEQDDEGSLLRFLATTPDNPLTGKPYYDLDYALRICKVNNKLQSCGLIYSKMGLYESSVDLALRTGDLELAKINAEKAEDDTLLRKKLWLKIAEYVVHHQKDIKTAMEFLESTDLLKIEDILPFFPDFVVIDEFKESICNALETYSSNIQKLKDDMEESNRTTKLIEEDLAKLSSRFLIINQDDECSSCHQRLLTRQFYLFPCQHSFHADCLIKEVMAHMPPYQLRRMLTIQNKLALQAPMGAGGVGAARLMDKGGLMMNPSSLLSDSKKLALASVQGLDHVRRMIIPDALVGVIGGGVGVIGSGVGALGGVLPIPKMVKLTRSSSSTINTSASSPIKTDHRRAPESSFVPKRSSSVHHHPSMPTLQQQQPPGSSSGSNPSELDKLKNELDQLLASQCALCLWAINSIDLPFAADGEVDI
ncbi:hypothetical protein PCASD_11089 [Puccinia coronata f. sp. avenae]|uniref:Pep3/Vps18/deep orange domain-containing protein n=1 Tax=Puccinia coronata f. sp. avenae TaxID=200324 RepID=A0A2N5TB67_9BASI|nr:hypothetical protein PCASD_11089 [Puccinia coronata f. sp. avenae]